jgi:GNAT superfamily N-acetyltransferase
MLVVRRSLMPPLCRLSRQINVRFPPVADIREHCHLGFMSLKIRNATAADAPAMHAIRLGVRENRLSDARLISEGSYLSYIAAGSAWVAEAEGDILGFAVIDAPAKSVWALFVRVDVEGAGVGRALHDQMLAWARQQGISRLSLSTERGSRAMNFYSQAGWESVSTSLNGEVVLAKSV